jgi:TonB-dependent receptor
MVHPAARSCSRLVFDALLAVALSLAVLSPAIGAVASENGSLRGRVVDANGRALPGATVRVEPGGIAVVTDAEGYFTVSRLAPGAYRVEVSYIGFVAKTLDATVGAAAPSRLEIKLQQDNQVKENVVVTASRERGEVEALNERKNSDNIVNVLPAEVITSLPNANLADAIGRLPSVSLERDEGEGKYVQIRGLASNLTNVTINGVQIPSVSGGNENYGRQIKLDGFSSDLVGNIQLYKTTSPDQEGDSIGGTVNLVNKAAGDEQYFNIGALGGYNGLQGGRYSTVANATYSNRFGPDKALGLVLGGMYDWNGRAINDVEPAPDMVDLPDGASVPAFAAIDYRDYRYDRARYGFAGGLDYRLGLNSSIFFKGFFTEFQNYGDRWVRSTTAGNFLTPNLTDDSGLFEASVQNRRPNEQTYSLLLGGNNDLHSVLVDYVLAYSHARQNRIGQQQGNFTGPSAAFAVDSSNGNFPRMVPLGDVNFLDPSQYVLAAYSVTDERSNAWDAQAALNMTVPFQLGDFPSQLKFGGKYRQEHKVVSTHNLEFNTNGSNPYYMSQGVDSFTDPTYYFNKYPQGPNASLSSITNFFNTNPGAFDEDTNAEHLDNDPNNFTVEEKIGAGYAMDTTTFGPVAVLLGVRVEHTAAAYTGYLVTTDSNGDWASTTPTSGSNSYTDPLPNVSVKWSVDQNTNLRAVWAWQIGRPDYGLLPPSFLVDTDKNQVNAGNPALVPQLSASYDLLVEHFMGSIGLVAAGGFYKNLTHPIYTNSASIISGGPFDGYTLYKPVNGPSAYIYGFEVAWQQHLGFLPGVFKGLGIDANYTYTHSKATFDPSTGRSGTAQLQRTTPNEYNIGLTYDMGPFSMRAAVTYNSATIFSYNYQDGAAGGPTGPKGDIYLYPHTQFDIQGIYTLPNGLAITVSALNLTNEVFGFYAGNPHWNIQREFYSQTVAVGLRLIR